MEQNMSKMSDKKLKTASITFVFSMVLFATAFIAFAVIAFYLYFRYTGIKENPNLQGLYPSIGLGQSFKENELEKYVGLFGVELQRITGTPMYGDRVREIILDDYTLVNGVYYYNDYLAANPPSKDLILLVFIITAVLLFFLAISVFAFIYYKKCMLKNVHFSKKEATCIAIFAFLSLNLYGFVIMLKNSKELA